MTQCSARVVVPEILDHLPPYSPDAIRSRLDLSRINFLMGNIRWICGAIHGMKAERAQGIAEIGAGDGQLCNKLNDLFPDCLVTGYDLISKPAEVRPDVLWKEGNVFNNPPPDKAGVLVANLFLHHFEAPQLFLLGQWMEGFPAIVINEPDRAALPHLLGKGMHPFINHVTRHDMHVSIRAGFSKGEIPALLGLDPMIWNISETCDWRGSRRVIARRRA